MNAYVRANLFTTGPFDGAVIPASLFIAVGDGWSGSLAVSIPFSDDPAIVNSAIKQAAADAVKSQHGVTLDPATEILLVGGAT